LIEQSLSEWSIYAILGATAVITAATLVSFFKKRKSESLKWVLFLSIALSAAGATLFISASTVYINLVSDTGGPVHWHADFEIWKCGERLGLKDPTGIENRIGTPLLHEHNDNRIHVEGTVVKKTEITLGEFFKVIGGKISGGHIVLPTNSGLVEMKDGDLCDGKEARLQVFVYKIQNPNDLKKWKFVQEKINNIEDYVMSPFSVIPPGDCIIIELDKEKDMTEKMCETLRISMNKGELTRSDLVGG
jgi:hypothetical protein